MKPSWECAPEWANYLAMDDDGRWYWYEHMPNYRFNIWWQSRESRKALALDKLYIAGESLEKRDVTT